MKRKITLFLSVLISTLVSLLIIFHSFQYLVHFVQPMIAFALSFTVEICFITISMVSSVAGRWTKYDHLLKVLLFVLSIIPATLEISSKMREVVFERLSAQAPVAPISYKAQIVTLEKQMQVIDSEIEALRKFKQTYDLNRQARTWYAFNDQKRINELLSERGETQQRLLNIQQKQAEEDSAYRESLKKFEQSSIQGSYQQFFDYAFLLWTLIMLWILQLINARMSSQAALMLSNSEGSNVSYDADLANNENNLESEKALKYLLEIKPRKLYKKQLQQFLTQNLVFTIEDLRDFVNKEYGHLIDEFFKPQQKDIVKRMLQRAKGYLTLNTKEETEEKTSTI